MPARLAGDTTVAAGLQSGQHDVRLDTVDQKNRYTCQS